jgi:uncharacterized coiled-coil DUF342 family protein
MALNPEQESIAQAIGNMGHATALHYSTNYRTAAQKNNAQKTQELDTRISGLRTELQNHVATTWANVSNQKTGEINQNASILRAEMSKLNTDVSLKHATIINDCNMIKNRCEELSGDVKFVRHELRSIGDKFTTLNHYVTNKNKEVVVMIESLQKELHGLKNPPKKSYTEYILVLILLMIVIGFGTWFNQSDTLMIDY